MTFIRYYLILVLGVAWFMYDYGYDKGVRLTKQEWVKETNVLKSKADHELLSQAQHHQNQMEESYAKHQEELRIAKHDAAVARDASERLRSDLNTVRSRIATAPKETVAKYAVTQSDVLADSIEAYRELAETADGHVADLRLTISAWPANTTSTFTEHLEKKNVE